MEIMARLTSRIIEKNETPALLSANEVKVLMCMKDQELHCDPLEGMKFGQFGSFKPVLQLKDDQGA